MKRLCLLLTFCLLGACASLSGSSRGGGSEGERIRLRNEAFDAYQQDSFRVAEALFQRLASDYPRTPQGHEARFFLGVIALEPRRGVDLRAAEQHFDLYITEDSVHNRRGYQRPTAENLRGLVRELRAPCDQRGPGLPCETQTDTLVVRRPGETPTGGGGGGGGGENAAEVARLRRELGERDATIRELRAELQRIRNTLAPRNP